MVLRFKPLLTAALAAAVFSGCSTTQQDPDEQIPAEVDEALGRERPDYEGKGPLERMFSGDDEADRQAQAAASEQTNARIARLEERLARMEQQLITLSREDDGTGRPASTPEPVGLVPELGLLLEDGTDPGLGNALEGALRQVTADAGLPFSSAPGVRERLTEAGCASADEPGCLDELNVYPGTRILVVVESAAIRSGAAVVTYRLMDTLLGTTRTAKTLRLPVDGEAVPAASLNAAADEILFSGRAMADRAPWQTRAFNREDGQWYLSAGQRSGLSAGDRLVVHAPGRAIPTPGGNVAGWVPGERKGLLEVTGFAGEDIAVARLVEGGAPAPRDPILPAEDRTESNR